MKTFKRMIEAKPVPRPSAVRNRSFTFNVHRPSAALILAATWLIAIPAASLADTIYLSYNRSRNIDHFTQDGSGSAFGNIPFSDAEGVAVDGAGNLYVADFFNSRIVKFTPEGVGSVFASSLQPEGLAFDKAGNLYVANFNSLSISKFTPDGIPSVFATTGLNKPVGLAFDSAGNLYVSYTLNNLVGKFTPDGVGSIFASTGHSPYGLAVDSADNVYVANWGSGNIEKFTPGGAGSIFAITAPYSPIGLAFDSEGSLYAANQSGSNIEKFTPDGVGSIFATTQTGANFITIVPEPQPLALLSLGLAACLVFRKPWKHQDMRWKA